MQRCVGWCGISANGFLAAAILFLCSTGWAAVSNHGASADEMPAVIEQFTADSMSLMRTYSVEISPVRIVRFEKFYSDELATLQKMNFDALSEDDKVDYLLLKNRIITDQHSLAIEKTRVEEMQPLIPFAKTIEALEESRRKMEQPDPEKAAGALTEMVKEIAAARKALDPGSPGRTISRSKVSPVVANRAALAVQQLSGNLREWFNFYNSYDPSFTWWMGIPYKEADKALTSYQGFLKEKLVGISADDKTTIIGDPVGRDALIAELQDNMIPYTPEELIAIAQTEMDWCMKEMLKASREMGYGDDWHKAVEHVKQMHVSPGEQPELIRKLVVQGSDFVKQNDMVTVPALADETWRMIMMTPQRQLVNPFFTGGNQISVSYPTDTMTYEQREMSMRGNNIPFAHATAFHEMIPGHFLQFYMAARYHPYRRAFSTPFWHEGDAFQWEMEFYDRGFDKTPEERVGALFWRMHRSARVMFTMRFHLGEWTPKQCVDFLIDAVGHEPENATAEVRRSFDGSVGPLYQCAYLMGALQIRALRKELVDSKKMTERQFHDAILHEGSMPIEMLRADLTQQKLTRDFTTNWKFYGPHPTHP
jgi:uncharacterized protein (DUF885 family)